MEQLLAQFHMVCVLFSNICTLLHSKIHTATAWVTTLSFRWIKLFFLPYSRFFFFHTSLRNDLVLAQISATNWKLYKLRRQRKEEKKVSGRFLFCSAGMEHNMLVEDLNRPILASDTLCWACSGWKFSLLTGHLHTHFCILFVFVLLPPAWSTIW